MVSWFSRKQNLVALSLTEAKYMASSMVPCEGMWLRKLLSGLFERELKATIVHYDNHSGIRLYGNAVFYDRRKHIDIKYHFLRDYVQKGTMEALEFPHLNCSGFWFLLLLKMDEVHIISDIYMDEVGIPMLISMS